MKKLERSAVMRVVYNPLVCTDVECLRSGAPAILSNIPLSFWRVRSYRSPIQIAYQKLCCLGTFFAHFCIEINNLVPVRSVRA